MTDNLPKINRKGSFVVLVILLLLSRGIMIWEAEFVADDAYITFRTAENIATGVGMVFNHGERVQVTSTPLFTLILAGIALVGTSSILPTAAVILGVLSDVVSLILLWKILDSIFHPARWLSCALFAGHPKVAFIGVMGMETPLVVLLMLSFALLLMRNRQGLAGILGGLLLVTRIDAGLWILCSLTVFAILRRMIPWYLLFCTALVSLPWFGFAQWYFGSVLPHSITAKEAAWGHLYSSFEPGEFARQLIPFSESLIARHTIFDILLMTAVALPAVYALVLLAQTKHWLILFPIFFLSYITAFAFSQIIIMYWYALPGFVSLFVTISVILDCHENYLSRRSTLIRGKGRPAILLLLIVLTVVWGTRYHHIPGEYMRKNRELAAWIADNTPATASVFLEPIGYMGWFTDRYLHDYVGLASPKVVEFRNKSPNTNRWYTEYLKSERPQYLCLRLYEVIEDRLFWGHGDSHLPTMEDRTWFDETYARINWRESYDENDFAIFRRKEP